MIRVSSLLTPHPNYGGAGMLQRWHSQLQNLKKKQYLLSTCYTPAFMAYLIWLLQCPYKQLWWLSPFCVTGNEAPKSNYLLKKLWTVNVWVRIQVKQYDTELSLLTTGWRTLSWAAAFHLPAEWRSQKLYTRDSIMQNTDPLWHLSLGASKLKIMGLDRKGSITENVREWIHEK